MHVKSVLSLATAGAKLNGARELAITHVTEDRGKSEFRRHAWLILTYLIDFYVTITPRQAVIADLHSLSTALGELAQEMEEVHAEKVA
jgi:hypothetical protein